MGFINEEYQDWLRQEMRSRDWNISDLARAAQRSHTAISNQLSGLTAPSLETCQSIAKAFQLPETFVLKKAGLIQEEIDESDLQQELIHKYNLLSPEMKQVVLDLVNGILLRQNREKRQEHNGPPEP